MVMSDFADRRAILSDSEILGHVRNVLRARGVPAQDVEDQLNEIVVHALRSPQLPLEREAAKKYLGGAARNAGKKAGRRRKRDEKRVQAFHDVEERVPDRSGAPADTGHLASVLWNKAMDLYPRTFPWFVRSRVAGETHESIAASENVPGGTVRSEVTRVGLALRGIAIAAALLALFFNVKSWKSWQMASPDHMATRKQSPAPPTAAELRRRAVEACDAEAWDACAASLQAANRLDPWGETPELRELRIGAELSGRKYDVDDLRDMHEMDAKPGLQPRRPGGPR